MARAKQASKRNRRSKAVPVLGAAGLSLSLAGGASASTGGPVADVTPQNTAPNHEIFLGDEEISDVSLSTFYAFDKENAAQPALGDVTFPVVTNRTPDAPEGTLNFGKSQFGKSKTFNTPSRRESNRS